MNRYKTLNKGHKANLFVISAASGTGKTSLVRALASALEEIIISISYTTRKPRPRDQEGVDYFFVSEDQFQKMIDDTAFLEHATVYGHHYGTSKKNVFEQLHKGNDILLEIDWQGALQIRRMFKQAKLIFILPPSLETLRERLLTRQQDPAFEIDRRMSFAQDEMKHFHEFDYLVVNDNFERAVSDLVDIVRAERLQIEVQEQKLSSLLAELLEKK